MTEEEKQKRIYEMQSPSMKKIMDRPISQDAEYIALKEKPLRMQDVQAVKDAETIDEMVAPRAITFEEASIYHNLRYNRGKVLKDDPKVAAIMAEQIAAAIGRHPEFAKKILPKSAEEKEAKGEKATDAFMNANSATIIFSSVKHAFFDLMKYAGLIKKEEVRNEK